MQPNGSTGGMKALARAPVPNREALLVSQGEIRRRENRLGGLVFLQLVAITKKL